MKSQIKKLSQTKIRIINHHQDEASLFHHPFKILCKDDLPIRPQTPTTSNLPQKVTGGGPVLIHPEEEEEDEEYQELEDKNEKVAPLVAPEDEDKEEEEETDGL